MAATSTPPGSAGPHGDDGEVSNLRRQLQRERALRRAAESVGERATAELYESVRELRIAQAELVDRAEQTKLLAELARTLRQDLDSRLLANRAAESAVRLTGADRCEVVLVGLGREPEATVRGTWSRTPDAAELPLPTLDELTDVLAELLSRAAAKLRPVSVEDLGDTQLLRPNAAAAVQTTLGVRSLAVAPVASGGDVSGWMLLESMRPRYWSPRELTMCESLSHDVVTSLLQVRVFEQQRESVRRLEDLDRVKDAFISTVSHELRTPLTSIVGYLEMMSEGDLGDVDQQLAQGIDIIGRNVVRLRALVEDLLTLSAYDARHVRLDLSPVDLAKVVDDGIADLASMAGERDVRVHTDVQPDLPKVLGDHAQLERALFNVLSNAVKFSNHGGEVETRLRARDGRVVLEVTDHGIGIPAAEQPRLFTRFFRSTSAIADEIQGTGLGLSLVKTIVESHRGTVTVDSTEGAGTTVMISLPMAR